MGTRDHNNELNTIKYIAQEKIKMLERREECDTYLTLVCRHQHSIEYPVKR
jgi:hypothetical protein